MLLSLALITMASSTTTLAQDPSLYVPFSLHDAVYTTLTEELSPVVLDYGGVEVLWDDQTEAFSASVGGNVVNDLVTGTTTEGYPSFEGKFTIGGDPTVHGFVIPGASSGVYTIYLTVPNNKPLSLDVSNPTGVAPNVIEARECGCSDGVDLSCTSTKCRNGASCDNGNEECEWEDVTS